MEEARRLFSGVLGRRKRREAREEKKEVEVTPALFETSSEVESIPSKGIESSRYIPALLRDQVLKRDNYQCSYTSHEGVRCTCRRNLELDHIVPFAVGGRTESENLRVLCSAHNLHTARLAFGAEFVERKIAGT